MGELDDLELLKAVHRHQCALISHGNLKEESFKDVQNRAKDLFQDMINILRPWEKSKSEAKQLDAIEAFKQMFGDPNDPAVIARHERQAKEYAVNLEKEQKEQNENEKKLKEFEEKLKENNRNRRRGPKK